MGERMNEYVMCKRVKIPKNIICIPSYIKPQKYELEEIESFSHSEVMDMLVSFQMLLGKTNFSNNIINKFNRIMNKLRVVLKQ